MIYRKSSISLPAYRPQSQSSSLSLSTGRIFYVRAKKNARGKCLHTHSIDPFRHAGDSLHPSTPSFPKRVSPSASLFHDNSIPSSLSSSSLSLFCTHARAQVLSFFLLSTPLWLSLTPLASPLRLFARTQDENVKPFLHYSTTERHSTRTRSRACPFRY